MKFQIPHEIIDNIEYKHCHSCNEWKILSEFSKDIRNNDKLKTSCKKCRNKYNKPYEKTRDKNKKKETRLKYYLKNKIIENKKRTDYDRFRKYNITPTQFNILLKKQNYQCANKKCLRKLENTRQMHLDHNHKTGKIRGILCPNCNICLGLCSDNINILNGLIQYLEENYDNNS